MSEETKSNELVVVPLLLPKDMVMKQLGSYLYDLGFLQVSSLTITSKKELEYAIDYVQRRIPFIKQQIEQAEFWLILAKDYLNQQDEKDED
jgi:hypothetical protein